VKIKYTHYISTTFFFHLATESSLSGSVCVSVDGSGGLEWMLRGCYYVTEEQFIEQCNSESSPNTPSIKEMIYIGPGFLAVV
jgi:hypothetical protein